VICTSAFKAVLTKNQKTPGSGHNLLWNANTTLKGYYALGKTYFCPMLKQNFNTKAAMKPFN
jgi:hypothetical protein